MLSFEKLSQNLFVKKFFISFFIKQIPRYFDIQKNRKKFKKTVLFFHVPSTGGSSINNFLIDYFGYKVISEIGYFKKNLQKMNTSDSFQNIKSLSSHGLIKNISYFKDCNFQNQFLKFSVIRDPKEMYISRYFYLKNFNNKKIFFTPKNKNIVFKFDLTFDEYLKNVKLNFFDNTLVRYFCLKTNNYSFEDGKPNTKFKELNINDLSIAEENCKFINNIVFNNSNIMPAIERIIEVKSNKNDYRYNLNKEIFNHDEYFNNEHLDELTNLDYKLIEKLNAILVT